MTTPLGVTYPCPIRPSAHSDASSAQNMCIGADATGQVRKDKAAEAGALAAVVDALNRPTNQSLVDQGIATLKLLTKNSKPLREQAIKAGAKPEWIKVPNGSGTTSSWTTSRLPSFGLTTRRKAA